MAGETDAHPPENGWTEFRDGKPVEAKAKRERDVAPRAVAAGLALLVAVIFITQNNQRVRTSFLFFDGHPRLWVVILVSLLLGGLLGQAVGLLFRRRKNQSPQN